MRNAMIAAAIALAGIVASPAIAADAIPQSLARQIDNLPAEFTWSAAAERRHEIMRQTQRQQRYGRGGYDNGPRRGYDRGYYRGYDRGYGYGPGPGYRRPPPYYGPRW